jgi:arabinose-5-phosphate isomerase
MVNGTLPGQSPVAAFRAIPTARGAGSVPQRRHREVEWPQGDVAQVNVASNQASQLNMPKSKASKDLKRTAEQADMLIASALRTLETEAAGIGALATAIHDGLGRAFIDAVELMRQARGRVIVTGMGKSGHVGRKIAATLASTGTPAFFVHPSEASHGDLGMIAADDVIMALSWSGETAELKDLTDYSRRFRIGLIALTAFADSTLGQAADVVLALPQAREACPHNLAPTTSTLMQHALGDALAIALLESRGFTARDFRVFHPGGRLGAMLKFVRDVMHTGNEVPLARLGTRMSDAITEMTAKTFGCVGIVDQDGYLKGIITDGDLRRHMSGDLLNLTVEAVMTCEPDTVRPDQLVSEVLELLNTLKRTQLIVVDAGKPVGVVHFHDLLRAGVA